MNRSRSSLGVWPLALLLLVAACKDDNPGTTTPDAGGSTPDTGSPIVDSGKPTDEASPGDGAAPGDGAVPKDAVSDTVPTTPDGGLVPCLDRPTDLDMPPSGALPCELLPPGFVAPK